MKKIFFKLLNEELDFVLDCIKNKKELDKNATDYYSVELYYKNNLPTFLQINTDSVFKMIVKLNYKEKIKNIGDWWDYTDDNWEIDWDFSKKIQICLFTNIIIYFKLLKIYYHYKNKYRKFNKEKRRKEKQKEEIDLIQKLPETIKNKLKMNII